MAKAAGMSSGEFWDSSLRGVFNSIEAYNIRENEAWQRTRLQAYIVYCSVTDENKRVPIYQFLELDGDPTPEEIAEQEKNQVDRDVATYYQLKEQGLI